CSGTRLARSGGGPMTATGCSRPQGIRAIRQLEQLAVSSPDPQIAAFARAFFEEHGPEARKMLADIEHHSVSVSAATRLPELGKEPFNLSDDELSREWERPRSQLHPVGRK